MLRFFLALAALWLAGCAAQPVVSIDPASLLNDAAFAGRPAAADADPFAVNDAMRRYLKQDIARQLRAEGPLRGLVAALASDQQLKLEYDAEETRTAIEAFEARAGNCLSLTIMTAALARELGLAVAFRRVLGEPVWSRSGQTLVANNHLNILLEPAVPVGITQVSSPGGIVIDFEPGADPLRQRAHFVGEAAVVAMFLNNRAAEAMFRGALDEAYWWARGAALREPRLVESFNTLGVIHWRRGDLERAGRAFRYVLAHEAENVAALGNLAGTLEEQGRRAEASVLRERLVRLQPVAPFHHYDLGVAALKARDFSAAREHFSRELKRNAYHHETHFGLAVAHLALGEIDAGRKHLRLAQDMGASRRDRELYAAKLDSLRARNGR